MTASPSSFITACRFNPTLGGTTDWTYSSAVMGYNSPALANAQNGATYSYRAESNDLSQWEEGISVYNSSTGVFTRAVVLYNSLGTGTASGQSGAGTKITFSTVPQVAIVALAEDLLSFNAAMSLTAAQQAQARANIAVGSGHAELIINKGVNIDQTWEGAAAFADGSNNPQAGASRATETYGPDNWRLGADSGTGNFTGRRSNVPGTVPGIDNLLRIDVTTADTSATAANNYHVEIPIEGIRSAPLMFGAATAQPVTVQFWWAGVNGTYALSAVEGVSDSRSCTKTFVYSGGGGAQQFFLTFPADTAGTWSRAPGVMGLKFIFDLGCGSTFETASVGVWQAGLFLRTAACTKAIATLSLNYITGFQADVGSVALPYRYVDIASDLIACQRFYFKTFDQGTAVAQNAGYTGTVTYIAQVASTTAGYGVTVRYPVALAQAPQTPTTFNPGAANAKWRNQSAATDSGVPTIFNSAKSGCTIYNPQVAGDTVLTLQSIHLVANARLGGF